MRQHLALLLFMTQCFSFVKPGVKFLACAYPFSKVSFEVAEKTYMSINDEWLLSLYR